MACAFRNAQCHNQQLLPCLHSPARVAYSLDAISRHSPSQLLSFVHSLLIRLRAGPSTILRRHSPPCACSQQATFSPGSSIRSYRPPLFGLENQLDQDSIHRSGSCALTVCLECCQVVNNFKDASLRHRLMLGMYWSCSPEPTASLRTSRVCGDSVMPSLMGWMSIAPASTGVDGSHHVARGRKTTTRRLFTAQ